MLSARVPFDRVHFEDDSQVRGGAGGGNGRSNHAAVDAEGGERSLA